MSRLWSYGYFHKSQDCSIAPVKTLVYSKIYTDYFSIPVKSLALRELTISFLNDSFISSPVQTLILGKVTSNLPDNQILPQVKKASSMDHFIYMVHIDPLYSYLFRVMASIMLYSSFGKRKNLLKKTNIVKISLRITYSRLFR